MKRALDAARLILECVILSCLVGIAQDMVTAHLTVEWFTIHHPRVIESETPWVLALVWGVIAAWWFGLGAGIVLAIVNWRRAVPLTLSEIRPVLYRSAFLLWAAIMMVCFVSWVGLGFLPESMRRPTFASDRNLLAVAAAHFSEYVLAFGFVVGMGVWIWRRRH